jgi:hypothetical protein
LSPFQRQTNHPEFLCVLSGEKSAVRTPGKDHTQRPKNKLGLKAIFMRSISGKRQATLFLQGLTKIRDRPYNPGFPLKIDNLFNEKYVLVSNAIGGISAFEAGAFLNTSPGFD